MEKQIVYVAVMNKQRNIFMLVLHLLGNKGISLITRYNLASFWGKKKKTTNWACTFICMPLQKVSFWEGRVSSSFLVQLTESLCMCCVVQEPYPGGKVGAGSLSLFAEYDMTNSYKQLCKMLILFVKELLIDLKWLVNIAECTHLLFLVAKDYRIAYLLGIPYEMKKRTNVHV